MPRASVVAWLPVFNLMQLSIANQVPILATSPFPWIQRFASIGDSYAAGLGSGHRIDWACSRYDQSYPNILQSTLLGDNPGRSHQFLACSGADTAQILQNQIPALASDLDLLTISAGGNDVGMTPVLSNCIYQFYMSSEDACQQAIQDARQKISSVTELAHSVTTLLEAAKPKMNQTHGLIYLTSYASFFAADDPTCDNTTWAVWADFAHTKQYLTRSLRADLNLLVHSVNTVLRTAAAAAGPSVHFIDYDAHIAAARGRYCEPGVQEPAPNRPSLAFYEWGTVDRGENKTELQESVGEGVPRGSWEGGIGEAINRTLQEHPDWEFDPEKGFVDKSGARDGVGDEGLGDALRWLVPDAYKRVFHLRPSAHMLVARLVTEDLMGRGWDGRRKWDEEDL